MRFFRGLSRNHGPPFFNGIVFRMYLSKSVGSFDNLDRFEQVFDQHDIPDPPEKFHGQLFDGMSSEKFHFWCFKGLYKQFY